MSLRYPMSRMMTRSMTQHLPKKRFHEDPYPPVKRRRVQKDDGFCLILLMLLITVVNMVSFLIYCYIYQLELRFESMETCPNTYQNQSLDR